MIKPESRSAVDTLRLGRSVVVWEGARAHTCAFVPGRVRHDSSSAADGWRGNQTQARRLERGQQRRSRRKEHVSYPTDMSRLMGKAFVLRAVSIKQPFISTINYSDWEKSRDETVLLGVRW